MENRKVFISLDRDGVKLLHHILQSLHDEIDEASPPLNELNKQYCILLPPSYMSCFNDEELPDGFYEWISKDNVLNQEFLISLSKIIANAELVSAVDSDNEFLCNCLHELADELPVPGSCILEVYLHAGKDYFSERNLQLLSPLKRLEISHQAYFGVLSPHELTSKDLLNNWLNFIDFNYISVKDLIFHCKLNPTWSGLVEVKLQNSYANIPLQHYFLDSIGASQPLFDTSALQNKNKRMTFDSRIEIISTVTNEMIPFHMINPNRFRLHSFPPMKEDSFNFFDLKPDDSENVLFLAFLRFDVCDDSHKFTSSDWMSYVNDPFTHHLSSSYCQQTLTNHCTLLIEFDKSSRTTFVYFFKMPDDINVGGFLKLWQTELGKVDDEVLNVGESDKKFYKNGATVIPTWQWCEKNAWHEEESLSKVVKSISRCKSDEFYMQGVMVPGIESIKDGVKHDFFGSILTIFDKNGMPVTSSLNPIPVIDDRLLKNMKGEENLTDMEFSDAKKQIGHGLDYCIDSLGSIRLSERLSKVQKQLVPEDTISFTSGKFSAKEELVMSNIKNNVQKTKVNTKKKVLKKKESRADKTKRRLRTIVEGTVTKYGNLPNTHDHYNECCNSLFDVCVALVKTLKTSKDLNNHMKQFAKTNVHHVVTSVLAKTKEHGS